MKDSTMIESQIAINIAKAVTETHVSATTLAKLYDIVTGEDERDLARMAISLEKIFARLNAAQAAIERAKQWLDEAERT